MSDTARERHRLSAHRDYSLRRIGKTHEQHHSHLTETQVQKCANLRLTLELEHSITYKAVLTFQVASNEQAIRVRSRFSEREGDFDFVEKVFDIGPRDSEVFGIGNAQGATEADTGTVEEREGAETQVQKRVNLRLTLELEHSMTHKAVLTFQVASNEQAIRVRSRFSEREGDFGFVEKVFDIGHRDSGVFGIGNAQGAAEADADAGTVEEREGAKPEPKVDLLKRIAEEGSAVKRPAQLKTWLERERKALLANDEMFPQSNGGKLRFESHKRRP